MATDYDRMFGTRSLNGKVEIFAQDVTRTRVFQGKFRQGRKLTAEDGSMEWDELRYSRGLAPFTAPHGQFPEGDNLTRVLRKSAVAHIKRSRVLDPDRLFYQRAPGELKPNAQGYLEGEMRDMVNEIGNSLEYISAESMRGTVTINNTNVPGSTVTFTLSYSPNTYTASAAWGTAGTKLLSVEFPALKQDFEQTSGEAPAQGIAGSTVEGYIVGNTEVTNFAQPLMGQRFIEQSGTREGPMLGGLAVGGIPFRITEGGYVPEGGAFTRYMPTTDQAIILPADERLIDVLGWAEGRGLIPQQQYGPASAAAELIQLAPQAGWYSYAMLEGNGPRIRVCVGYVGLPVVIRPDAVMVVDGTP